jgi:catechol 2,3-dioxygenase
MTRADEPLEPADGVRDPEELEATGVPAHGRIASSTHVGTVGLTVSELGRSLAYYENSIGLKVLDRAGDRASLGAGGRELLHLTEEPGARPAVGYTGLYHFALLVPSRIDLARWLAHAARDRVPLTGLSDHFVSEALYLSDPDGHGIEIYWDRPREVWEGQVAERMTTLPLDVRSLLSELPATQESSYESLPEETVMGHVHLKVAAIPATVAFYSDLLGFALMATFGSSAAFLSAGGYHHHLGANTWESAGASPPPPGTARLQRATIALPDEGERRRVIERLTDRDHALEDTSEGPVVRDPAGNAMLMTLA